VLTGSTNWTYTGTCGQSNNAILLNDPTLAKAYKDYWDALQQDTKDSGNEVPITSGNVTQGPQRAGFRARNAASPVDVNIDGGETRVWFSPNAKVYNKTASSPKSVVDLDDVYKRIADAKQGVIFLAFEPGSPSVVEQIAAAKQANPNLFVRGAATSGTVATGFNTSLYHRDSGTPDLVVTATEINDEFDYWAKELLTLGRAVIHDKIVVIDPFSDKCVVITGSHNLGFRASTNNDENLLIIQGHRKLAEAYATHVMDVYDHYRWRFRLQEDPAGAAYRGLDKLPTWQDKYFTAGGATPTEEVAFWLG
jgi:phosphatidylserine/phosphatidylglycerophosphate/cardiolipin synthase-like enzyme